MQKKSENQLKEEFNMLSVKNFRVITPKLLREPIQKLRGKSIYHDYYDENKCIFIHIPKAAGQSVSLALFNDKHPGHWSIKDFEWENERKLKYYYTFTFVRNPWDRLVSAYFYLKNSTPYLGDQNFAKDFLSEYESFEDFVLNGFGRECIINWVHFRPQISFLLDSKGKLNIDYIGKLESLESDFEKISAQLNFDAMSLPKKTNTSKRSDYRSYFNNEMKEKVEFLYSDDIKVFNYVF